MFKHGDKGRQRMTSSASKLDYVSTHCDWSKLSRLLSHVLECAADFFNALRALVVVLTMRLWLAASSADSGRYRHSQRSTLPSRRLTATIANGVLGRSVYSPFVWPCSQRHRPRPHTAKCHCDQTLLASASISKHPKMQPLAQVPQQVPVASSRRT